MHDSFAKNFSFLIGNMYMVIKMARSDNKDEDVGKGGG